jgi:hypothetical protein
MSEGGSERQSGWARALAGLIALAAWVGIGVHFQALADGPSSWAAAVWTLIRFFTVTTNLLIAVIFTGVALCKRFDAPRLLGGALLSILLVGVVYALLLHGLQELTGGSRVANVLLHGITPVLTFVFWLAFVRKGALTWSAPFLWALYPLAYLFYALVRGAMEGRYPYPFINVIEIGLSQALLNSSLIAVGFVVAGEALVWLDRRLAGRAKPKTTFSAS